MRVLVTGAYGFIGAAVVAALIEAGHTPVAAVRRGRLGQRLPGVQALPCDLACDVRPEDWLPRLADIDAVVNCAGILRERGNDTHAAVHEAAPRALFEACVRCGVRRVVQVSALGDPQDGEFIASKHRADAALMALPLDWVVLRPSVVVSTRGSYGGSSLLRALAALPATPVPGTGGQRLQPILLEDLARAVVAAIERPQAVRECLELGGPDVFRLRDYLGLWRAWLGFGRARFLPLPRALARAGAAVAERFGGGPLGLTVWRMLERGNVLAPGSFARSTEVLDFAPAALASGLARDPSHSADRWHARLHLMAPLLRAALALTWIASGVVGLLLPETEVLALMRPSGLPEAAILVLAWGGSAADIALGALLLLGWRTRLVLGLMAVMVLTYTLTIGILLPAAWLDPFGGLLKNGLILIALAIAAATAERD